MNRIDRPAPSDYLPQFYIDAQLQKFGAEGGAFVVIKSWIANPKYPNFPDRKFVGLRSEMDAVIKNYEASGGDWRVLRDELSIGENVDLSKDEILYVTVAPDDPRFVYELPSGREAGTYGGEWVPGGRTKGGTQEASLIGSEKVTHKNSLEELQKHFLDRRNYNERRKFI